MSLKPLFERLAAKAPAIAQTTAAQRAEKLLKLAKAVMDARPAILAAGKKELRLSETDVDAQLLMVKSEAEFIARNLAPWMVKQPVQGTLMTLGKKCYVQYEAKGVVLNLATWNAPIAIGLVPLMGAIAAGCTMLLKPSELAPDSAEVLAKIIASVFAEDEFAVVQGGPEVAQELLALPFNHIFFIGGHAVGRMVMRAAAEHFASITLEMGGKNPTIVDASADLEDAGRKIAWGRVANCGQVCLAPDGACQRGAALHRRARQADARALRRQRQGLPELAGAATHHQPPPLRPHQGPARRCHRPRCRGGRRRRDQR